MDNDRDEQIAALASASGKTVAKAFLDLDSGMNGQVIIEFTDGDRLEIEYDWIYSITVAKADKVS